MAVTAPSSLPGNILTTADSDFEAGPFTWAPLTNASGPTTTAAYSFSGSQSLEWMSNAAGDSFIASGYYPCRAGDGYVFSGYINTVSAPHDTYLGVQWYSSSHTAIGSPMFGNDNPSAMNAWQPISVAATSPAGAAYFKIQAWVSTHVAADEVFVIDLLYANNPPAQVLIDFVNPAFETGSGAGQDFVDVTPWVRWDSNITFTHGRQDSVSEIQAGTAVFNLQNDLGWFSPQLSASPYFPHVSLGCRTQVNVSDQAGNWSTRFDGAISQITYTVDTTGNTNMANVTVSDVLAMLNRSDPLTCWTKETVLADNPLMHWTLNDAGTTGTAAETGGHGGPALYLTDYGVGTETPSVTWSNGNGGVESLADAAAPAQPDGGQYWNPGSVIPTSLVRGLVSGGVGPLQTPLDTIYFSPNLTAQAGQNLFGGTNGFQLQAGLSLNGIPQTLNAATSGAAYTVECWFTMDPGIKTNLGKDLGPFTILALGSPRHSNSLSVGIYYSGTNTINFEAAVYNQPPSFAQAAYGVTPTPVTSITSAITADSVPVPHHLVIEITGSFPAGTATIYLDNVSLGTVNLMEGQVFDWIYVGGALGGSGNWFGNIALVSIYEYALSQSQIELHCMAGQYGYWEQTTDNCVAALGRLAGIPGYWNNLAGQYQALSMTEYLDITGQTALSAMQFYEQAERGLLFVNMAGQLTFHSRDWRMGYGAADLVLPPDVYNADLGYELVDTNLINEAATATVTYTTGIAQVNLPSQQAYSVYANGAQQSPVQLPLITWSRAYSTLGLVNTTGTPYAVDSSGYGVTNVILGFYPDPNLTDNAAWQVNTKGQPSLICGQLTIDLLTLDPTSGLTVTDFYELNIDNMVTLDGMPVSFPDQPFALDYFIEGINETIGQGAWTLTLYTSPAAYQRAWKPGDPVYGVLGSTSRIGISAPDTNPVQAIGKSVSHDAGPPYWPPTFAANNPLVYQVGYDYATVQNPAITPLNPVNDGDCIIVEVLAPVSATISVTDSQSNAYALIGSVTFSTHVQYLFASFNSDPLNVSQTITITTSSSQAYVTSAYGIVGVAALDGTVKTATGSSANPTITPNAMSAASDVELVIIANGSGDSLAIPSGWTEIQQNISGSLSNQLYWRQATSLTGDTCAPTMSGSGAWGAIAVSLTTIPTSLNNPANNDHGFIGANDLRGIANTLQTALEPPLLVVGCQGHTQTFTTGNNGITSHVIWDTVYVDTAGGMAVIPSLPNWYCAMRAGFYEISGSFAFQAQSSGTAGVRAAWIAINRGGAQAMAAGTSTPYSGGVFVSPIGEQLSPNTVSRNAILNPVARVYLGIGDMITIGIMQDQGASLQTSTNYGGPIMSARWVGYGTEADQIPQAFGPGAGPISISAGKTTYKESWNATGSFSYFGTTAIAGNSGQLRFTNQGIYVGQNSQYTGSQFGFATFNTAQIQSVLSGASILQVELTMGNTSTYYSTGSYLRVGYTNTTSFGQSYAPGAGDHFDVTRIPFKDGQTMTTDLTHLGIGTALANGNAQALAFGDNKTTSFYDVATWLGNTFPKLTITYEK